jgi:uncharacterized membrane protein
LAVFLAAAGTTHFLAPKFYDPMVPRLLPGPARAWTYGSGAVELAVGAAVALPRTRRIGGFAAAGLFLAVLPANVQMAVDAFTGNRPARERVLTLLRLPLQAPLVRWALRIGASS